MGMVESQSYSYALPPGYVSVYRPTIQPVKRMGYSPYLNYYSYQHFPIYGRWGHSRFIYTYINLPQHVPISSNLISANMPPKQPDTPAKFVALSMKSSKTTPEARSSGNKLVEDSEKGFKLLDDLVETVSQAAGTATEP